MPTLRCNPGVFHYSAKGKGGGSFRPQGPLRYVGKDTARRNPEEWDSEETLAARLFVGFNVGDKPKYDLDDLIEIVKRLREDKQGASFVAQKGIYQHKHGGPVVVEDGAQVILIDVWGSTPREWEEEMKTLAENVAAELEQEMVVVEIQKNGMTQKTIGMSPPQK